LRFRAVASRDAMMRGRDEITASAGTTHRMRAGESC
jgi:hypothetical protein